MGVFERRFEMVVELFVGPDKHENREIRKALTDLGHHVSVKVRAAKKLRGKTRLPFIEVSNGERYFGGFSIGQFVAALEHAEIIKKIGTLL